MSSLRREIQDRINEGELAMKVRGEFVPWPADFLAHLQKVADRGISLPMQKLIAEKITCEIMAELLVLYNDERRCGGIPSVLHSMCPKKAEGESED